MQWMNPRPVWRWKSFWLGVVVLCFLGWAWVRSRSQWEMVTWLDRPKGEVIVASQGWGQVGVAREIHWGGASAFEFARYEISDVTPLFPQWYETGDGVVDGGNHRVAHWLVMLVFLVMWGTFLGWRWRRVLRHEVMAEGEDTGKGGRGGVDGL